MLPLVPRKKICYDGLITSVQQERNRPNMNEMILLKLGELVLKGLNRRSFEDKLPATIHRR